MSYDGIVIGREIGGIKYTLRLVSDSADIAPAEERYKDISYIIISGYHNASPAIERAEINESQSVKLKERIVRSGYYHTPLWAGFTADRGNLKFRERAFIVFNFKAALDRTIPEPIDGLFKLGVELTQQYGQNFFVHKDTGRDSPVNFFDRYGKLQKSIQCENHLELAEIYFRELSDDQAGEDGGMKYLQNNLYIALAPNPKDHRLVYHYSCRRETYILSPHE